MKARALCERAKIAGDRELRKPRKEEKKISPAPCKSLEMNEEKKLINDVNIKRLLIYYKTGPQVD